MEKLEAPQQFQDDIEFISFDEVQDIIPLSKSRLYALMRERRFPRPVKIGEHRAVWIKHEIIAYRAARIAERDVINNPIKEHENENF